MQRELCFLGDSCFKSDPIFVACVHNSQIKFGISYKCRELYRIMFLFLACSLLPHNMSAQSAASVSGTIVDSSGALIPEASVTLRNTDTNVQQATITSSSGTYSIINVAPGNYSIEVT